MNEVKDLSPFAPFLAAKVEWKGQKHHFRFIFTGCKGDWPFLRSAYNLNCGYNCTAKCHRCELKESGQNSNYLIKDSIRVPINPNPQSWLPLEIPRAPQLRLPPGPRNGMMSRGLASCCWLRTRTLILSNRTELGVPSAICQRGTIQSIFG